METVSMAQKKGITGTALKLIAIIAMFIDHFAAIYLEGLIETKSPAALEGADMMQWYVQHPSILVLLMIMIVMRLIGRFGFPIFAFLIVEGFEHTHSVARYACNLAIFALISEIPFNLGFQSRLFAPIYQNVFFTLLLGLLCIWVIRELGESEKTFRVLCLLRYPAAAVGGAYAVFLLLRDTMAGAFIPDSISNHIFIYLIGAAVALVVVMLVGRNWNEQQKKQFAVTILALIFFSGIAELIKTDYGAGGVLTIGILYLLRRRKMLAFSMACLELTVMSIMEITAFFMLIPIAKYNGSRGKKINKYLFYAFYPVHILLIYLLTLMLHFTTFSIR
ncbi:MAG: hypothetical protein J5898_00600 [Lachnospiraceae bacterium]|nr:hypothetical protein [Lachnospiraceae bacterium]